MAQQRIVLVNDGNTIKARPAFLQVQPGDQVRFSNWAGATVSLTFQTGLFEKAQLSLGQGSKDSVTVQDVPDGRYPYQGTANGVPVVGESSPEIIVDR